MHIENLIANVAQPDICAKCPRHTTVGRVVACALLGEDYAAPGCNPDDIVDDPELKNQLFDEGIVARPSGLRLLPGHQQATEQTLPGMLHPRHIEINFSFGIGGKICPQDIPAAL